MGANTKQLKDYTIVHNLIIRTDKLDVYQKSCINNILSNVDEFRIALSILARRIPCSKDKCIKTINSLKELSIISVNKTRTLNGDWDSNLYKVELVNLFKYIEVVVEKDNVVFNKDYLVVEKDNGSTPQRQQVVVEKDNKNTNKNTNKNIYSANDIENIWSLYPNKKGKSIAIKKIPKLLKKYGKEQMERCIARYSKEVEGKEKQYILNGSTFFNGRYEDYLDNNFIEEIKAKELDNLEDYIKT
ncbi:hypothetical protein JW813_16815 [Clostridium botulinum]|uniref:hypothetical protein n=1 Tax=Clostridium botulinum TaxID=1491 RepID=UPI0013F93954|nr:hypothetical protein [Clostridium botulinum]NFN95551.1 hypothetical protein [Clostridium botulinum]NFS97441.1 hypothetical protein [Clostridium botulinum]UZP03348.1 hypothetical protein JW813_16815 [Clostridium botulinum]UZP06706.1 hypothetical protein JYA71_17085 [Clostridium botulinum]UZP10087.1 hypothetical protein JYA74_16810 [Clostridium botulinum]